MVWLGGIGPGALGCAWGKTVARWSRQDRLLVLVPAHQHRWRSALLAMRECHAR
jgi:hypothetical protein